MSKFLYFFLDLSPKEDMRKLQVVKNKVVRIKTENSDLNTPTTELLAIPGYLSVQQHGALHTVYMYTDQ